MAVQGQKRGPYRKGHHLSVRRDGYVYHRAVPDRLQAALGGRKVWMVWLGSVRKISKSEAEFKARRLATEHDVLIMGLDRLSAAEREHIAAEKTYDGLRGLDAWQRNLVHARGELQFVELAAHYIRPDPETPEDWQARDALEGMRARQQAEDLATLIARNTKTERKLTGDTRGTLSGLVDLWVKVNAPRNPATVPTARRFMAWLVDAIGDKPPRAITADDARAFRAAMEKNGRSFATIRKALERLSAIFNVALAEGKCDINPFHRIKPHGRPAAKFSTTRRLPWTPEQLRTIVARCDEMGADEALATRMLIFSGARPNEVCQLRCDDVLTVEGIEAIRITDDGDRQSLKNEDSRRTVPIHPVVRAEVLAHVATRRAAGKERLFDFAYMPSLGTFSHTYGQRFTKWKRSVGFISGQQVAHSFRHSFKDAARSARLPPYVINQMVGHELEKGAAGGYGVGVGMRELAKAIAKVDPLKN